MCLQQPELMVSKTAEFLGRSLSAEQISHIVRQTRFNKMKQDSSVNYSWWDELGMRLPSESQFMRKGATYSLLVVCTINSSMHLCLDNYSPHIQCLPTFTSLAFIQVQDQHIRHFL